MRAQGTQACRFLAGARAPVASRVRAARDEVRVRARAPDNIPRTCAVRGRGVPALGVSGRDSAPCRVGVWEGRVPGQSRLPLAAAVQRWRRAVRRSPRAAGGGALPYSAGSSAAWVSTAPAAVVGEDGC